MRRRRWRGLTRDEFLADPEAPRAVLWGLERGGRQAMNAWAWAVGWIRDNRCAPMALRVLERYKREQRAAVSLSVTVAAIPVAEGVEVRASLAPWGGRELAHLRTWFRGRDGHWRPTRRGVTVPPESRGGGAGDARSLRSRGARPHALAPGAEQLGGRQARHPTPGLIAAPALNPARWRARWPGHPRAGGRRIVAPPG